jgi:protein-S-isoprenylcysteine O-methyltransferase Ste14
MSRITTFLKRLIRRIIMNSTWWTALGAMAIPVGAVLMIEKPETAGISQWIIIAGFVFATAGLALTVWEARQKRKREMESATREASSTLILHHIALALGVNMDELLKEEKALLDEAKKMYK